MALTCGLGIMSVMFLRGWPSMISGMCPVQLWTKSTLGVLADRTMLPIPLVRRLSTRRACRLDDFALTMSIVSLDLTVAIRVFPRTRDKMLLVLLV